MPEPGNQPSTIAEVDATSGRLLPRRQPLAYLIIWGPRNERRAVVLDHERAQQIAATQHGQVVPLGPV